jgi:hypothetical protein
LRNHLRDNHAEAWFSACDKLGLNISAKTAQKKLAEFRFQQGSTLPNLDGCSVPEQLRQGFSKETFIDAIVDFIIADDQVRLFITIYYSNLT